MKHFKHHIITSLALSFLICALSLPNNHKSIKAEELGTASPADIEETSSAGDQKKNMEETKIFFAGDETAANYFRIPNIYTLNDGRILASADARYGGTHDSPNNIAIASSYSDDNGMNWSESILALSFDDYANQQIDWPRDDQGKEEQIKYSASFIDSAILEDSQTGNIYLFADVMPAGVGNSIAWKNDSGFEEIDGQYFLKLRSQDEEEYHYLLGSDQVIYDQRTGEATDYSVDDDYNILRKGEPLYTEQYSVDSQDGQLLEYQNGTKVKMNIFYHDSLFKVVPTNYMGYTVSQDQGESWSSLTLLDPLLGTAHNAPYLSPGGGLETSNGRLLVSSYTESAIIYIMSDNHGKTWFPVRQDLPFSEATAESQTIELEEGTLATFTRTDNGKIGYSMSHDNGDTWTEITNLDIVDNTQYGTQVSALKYSGEIEGKPAVILSTPNSTQARENGELIIGLYNGEKIEWKYRYTIPDTQNGFSYSDLTETADNKIALHYENYDSWSRDQLHLKDVLLMQRFDIQDIVNQSKVITEDAG